MSKQIPSWLPPIVKLEDFSGDWNVYIDNLYKIFQKDFITSRPKFANKPVICDNRNYKGKCESFWHITSETDRTTGNRIPSLRRCERVPWAKPTIANSNDSMVSIWENTRKRKTNILIFIESCGYLIVLIKRKNILVLATSYLIDKPHKKAKLIKERDAYLKTSVNP